MSASAEEPKDLPPPPAAVPADRWALELGPVAPTRRATAALAGPTEPPRGGRRTILVAGLGAFIVLAVAAAAAAYLFLRGSTVSLLERIPADVDAVAVAYLDPSASQKLHLAQIADEFRGISGPDGIGERLETWADEALDGTGVRFDDVTSWLGAEVAVAADAVGGTQRSVVVADVDDRDAAEAMLAKLGAPDAAWDGVEWTERDYRGVTLSIPRRGDDVPAYAFDDDALILATHADMLQRVIDTHRGTTRSITTSASFQEAEAELPDGRLALGFVDTTSLEETEVGVAAAAATSVGGLGDLGAVEGIGATVSAESDGIALDVVAAFDAANLTGALRDRAMAPDHRNVLLTSVPEDAWGVAAVQHIEYGLGDAVSDLEGGDPAIAAELRRSGLTGAGGVLELLAGDMAIAVSPDETTTVGVALLLSVDDTVGARDAVERLATGLSDTLFEQGTSALVRWDTRTHPDGTRISFARGGSVAYAVRDDMLVVGTTVEQVQGVLDASSGRSLTDDPAYLHAVADVPTSDGVVYVDVARVVTSIRDALPPEERDDFDDDVAPDLSKIRSVTFGSDINETRHRFRMFITVPADDEVTS